jgi:hypothetical protein
MFITLLRLGSMVIDISDNRLDAKFLRETGAIDDHFTIIKGEAAELLRIARVRMQNGTVEIAWKSRAAGKYQIEQANDPQNAPWEVVSPEVIATGATCFWSVVAEPGVKGFYRVKEFQ